MPLSALLQTRNVSGGLASPHSYEYIRRQERYTPVNMKPCHFRFHHHLINARKQMKGSATTQTLPGFLLPLALSTLTTTWGSKVYQARSAHNRCVHEIEELYHGNKAYIANMSETNPGLLQNLANNGQSAYPAFFCLFQNQHFLLRFIRTPIYAGRLFG